jgi:hypothetical protein
MATDGGNNPLFCRSELSKNQTKIRSKYNATKEAKKIGEIQFHLYLSSSVAVKKKSKQFETIIYLTDHAEKVKGDHQSAASNKSTETFKII